MQGNCGNILGDGAAAMRYTNAKLSRIGDLMLEDINKSAVDFKPNYDESTTEPVTLPSKFPYLLCGNNSGIAVGLSSDLVSHNYTEVMGAIKYYIDHQDCSIADLMNYIKGPDFPTGGKIINGEELLETYTKGHGSVRVVAHYDIVKKGQKTVLIFHDLPYGVEIDSGVKTPLKKLVLDEGYDIFEDVNVNKSGARSFDISITLSKNADISKALEILFTKTRLASSIKINQTVIVDGEPKQLNLKELIQYWVNYRSNCIKRIAQNDYDKTNHKLTVTIGLQKCMSDIDELIHMIRNSDNRASAKVAIMRFFELNDEQADAVLDMQLSRLNRLDLEDLNKTEKQLEETLRQLKETIDNEQVRFDIIKNDLDAIKKIVGKDERLTEIHYAKPTPVAEKPLVKEEYQIYRDGLHVSFDGTTNIDNSLVDIVFAYGADEIISYHKDGTMSPITSEKEGVIGAMVMSSNKDKIVSVTKNGNIKVSSISDYRLSKINEKIMKIKDGDELVYADFCNDNDFIVLFDGQDHVLKLAIKDLVVATKLTVGTKSGFAKVSSAVVTDDTGSLLFVTKDLKGKLTPVKDFSVDNKGNKGQLVNENTWLMRRFDEGRDSIYLVPKQGKVLLLSRNKISLKSRNAIGALLSTRVIVNVY